MIANPILVSSVGPPNYIASITLPGAILEAYQSLSAEGARGLCAISTRTYGTNSSLKTGTNPSLKTGTNASLKTHLTDQTHC
jgi:hypothetical protein